MRNNIDWENLNLLVTGGTGSFGKKFVEIMLRDYKPNKIIIFSRDELKQHEMRIGGLMILLFVFLLVTFGIKIASNALCEK